MTDPAALATLCVCGKVGVGLAIVLQFYRMRRAVVLDDVQLHHEDADHERVAG